MFFVHFLDGFIEFCKILVIGFESIPMNFVAVFLLQRMVVFVHLFQSLKLLNLVFLLGPPVSLEISRVNKLGLGIDGWDLVDFF